MYRISDAVAIITTTDFFPPVVDDPYDFGAIAAANALSDVYAMGGEPLVAINLVAYPDGYGYEILTEILRGGAEKVREAGAVLAGGHTVTDKEPKYGLSVTGRVHPQQIITKGGARAGDTLILTKPLGSGLITTAHKNDLVAPEHLAAAVTVMKRLNASAARAAQQFRVHAMTDITGYGLIGHAHEMAHLSGVDFVFALDALPWLEGARGYAARDIAPGGTHRNKDYYAQWVIADSPLDDIETLMLYDPQTSGGLLMSVAPEKADDLLAMLVAGGDNARIIGHARESAQGGLIHIAR